MTCIWIWLRAAQGLLACTAPAHTKKIRKQKQKTAFKKSHCDCWQKKRKKQGLLVYTARAQAHKGLKKEKEKKCVGMRLAGNINQCYWFIQAHKGLKRKKEKKKKRKKVHWDATCWQHQSVLLAYTAHKRFEKVKKKSALAQHQCYWWWIDREIDR